MIRDGERPTGRLLKIIQPLCTLLEKIAAIMTRGNRVTVAKLR